MIGKLIGAAAGRAAANRVGRRLGGTTGALIGAGLASRGLRRFALAGLALTAGKAIYDRYRAGQTRPGDAASGRSDPPQPLP